MLYGLLAIPATMLVFGQVISPVAQSADALNRDPSDTADRLRKAQLWTAGALVAFAVISGNTGAIVGVTVAAAGSYFLMNKLILN